MLKYYITILIFAVINFFGFAYSITGSIVDEISHKPLHGAVFLAKNEEKRVVIGIQADENGRFTSAEVSDSMLNIMVYYQNYDTLRIMLHGLPQGPTDLGEISLKRSTQALKEITVTASPVVQGTDKFIVYPTIQETEQNGTSLGLLTQLQYRLPGLRVVETLGQVTIYGNVPEYLINGRKVHYSRIAGLNNSNILRIEYYDNPQLRFGDRPAINFILKPRTDGGSIVADANTAITTINTNGNLALTYFRGKSEWNFNYNISRRSYSDRRVNSIESFISSPEIINRTGIGLPGKFAYTDNRLSLDYTFMPSIKTLLAVNLTGNIYRQNLNDITDIVQTTGAATHSFQNSTNRTAKLKTPSIDLYLRHMTRDNHILEANAFGTYNDGNFLRDYTGNVDNVSIKSNTDNSSWRAGIEVKYNINLKNTSAFFGVSDSYNHSTSNLSENGIISLSKIDINNLFIFGQLSGRLFKKLSYTGSIGLKAFHSTTTTESRSAVRGKGSLNLTYNISRPFSISYMFLYDPSMPMTESQSEIIQSVNDIEVRTGNINIQPSMLIKNQIRAQLFYKSYVAMLSLSHSRTNNPIFYDYSLITDTSSLYYNRFLSQCVNGLYNESFCAQGEFLLRNIFNYFNIGAFGGWCSYKTKRQTWNDCYDFGFAGMNASFFVENFMISAQYTIAPFFSLSGNTYSRPERWNTITAQYKYRNCFFKVTAVNLFTKRGSQYHSWAMTPSHIIDERINIRNCANMIILSITYRANFGKSLNKGKRTLKNGGVDSGVNFNL